MPNKLSILAALLLGALSALPTLAQIDRAQLRNLSTRGSVTPNTTPIITGFVVGGTTSKPVLLRSVGPGLTFFGIFSPLARPTLTLFDSTGRQIARNTGWANATDATEIQARASAMGAFPFSTSSADSALLLTLAPGAYTAHLTGDTNGVGLLELYTDRQLSGDSRIVNLSTRVHVGTGESVAIVGLATALDRRILIRAIGPGLTPFGVDNVLADPVLELVQPEIAGGTSLKPVVFPPETLVRNDQWETPTEVLTRPLSLRLKSVGSPDEVRAATRAAGAFPLSPGSQDAALLVELGQISGLTVSLIVRGARGESGTALIEVYDLGPPPAL